MLDWGKETHAGSLNQIQAEAWKSLFNTLDSNSQVFILFDRSQRVIAFNQAAAKMTKSLRDRFPAKDDPIQSFFPSNLHEPLAEPIRAALEGLELSLDLNLGDRAYTLAFSPLYPLEGQPDAILLNIVETHAPKSDKAPVSEPNVLVEEQVAARSAELEETNRKLRSDIEQLLTSQADLQASETFFRQYFLRLPDPILIWEKDEQGEFRLAITNQAAADLTGSSMDDLHGLLLDDFYSRSLHFIGPVHTAFSGIETRQTEFPFISHSSPEQKWVSCDCIPLSDRYVLNILRDISQQKDRQRLDENDRNQIELLRQAMTAFTSVLNMDQVLENVLSYLDKLIPYDHVILYLVEENQLHVQASGGFSEEDDPLDSTIPLHNPQFEAINRNRQPLFLPNALEYRPFKALGLLNCGESWLGVPLMGRGQILGYISIYSDAPAVYDNEHARLAEIFANEASIAIENARLFEQVQILAVTDELTGFFNRRYFYELVDMELARARRYRHPVSLIMIDIDHFKTVNDSYGHTVGDLLLKEICALIHKAVRDSDILGRHGGEEFVLLLPETALNKAVDVAERLRRLVADHHVTVGDRDITISVSAGVATFDDHCRTADDLFRCADMAMYQAKQAGRNQVHADRR